MPKVKIEEKPSKVSDTILAHSTESTAIIEIGCTSKPSVSGYLGTFVISAAVATGILALQSLMSLVGFAQAALIITYAVLFGIGLGGTVVAMQFPINFKHATNSLCFLALIYSISTATTYVFLSNVSKQPVDTLSIYQLPALCALLTLPFFAYGLILARELSLFRSSLSPLLGVAIIGALTGIALSSYIQNHVGPEGEIAISIGLASLAGLFLSPSKNRPIKILLLLCLLIASLTATKLSNLVPFNAGTTSNTLSNQNLNLVDFAQVATLLVAFVILQILLWNKKKRNGSKPQQKPAN